MSENDSNTTLKVNIKYKDLEANFEGNYSEVWKLSNDFLKGIKQNLDVKSQNLIFTTRDKTVADIIIDLRNSNYFDSPKSRTDCFNKFKNLGKTGITPNAISMALKLLVEKGELKRRENSEKLGKFVYIAPYID